MRAFVIDANIDIPPYVHPFRYDVIRERSPAPMVSTSIALVGAVLVAGLKVPAPLAVLSGGLLGLLAWSVGLMHA